MRDAILHHGSTVLRAIKTLTGSQQGIVVSPPSWGVRIGRWFAAVIACFLVFQLYVLIGVPWIEPPSLEDRGGSGGLPSVRKEHDAELEELFAPDAWERDKPIELKTQWGRLLCQRYVRIEKGIELHPCTILFRAPFTARDGTRGKRTIVLKTPNKAVVSFAGDFNLVRPQPGELKGALLEGDVQIYSHATSEDANDALNIVTRNIQILPTQIWTPHEVAFEYGASRGNGRLLSITIDSNEDNDDDSTNANRALVHDVSMLELVHIDQLHLVFPGRGLPGSPFERTKGDRQSQPKSKTTGPTSTAVDVTCHGPFQFDFRKGVATLHDHVDVVRLNTVGDNDHLQCDQLRIYFQTAASEAASTASDEDRASSNKSAKPADADEESSVPAMNISRIEAVGADVVLQAPSVQAAGRGELLRYDFQTRRILLQDSQKAFFAFRQHVVEAPKLEYELREDPKRLGKLWATGPGVYRGALGNKTPQPVQVVWEGTLELQPQDDLHVLSVAQGADIDWGEMGSFTADKLFVWLAEVVVPDSTREADRSDPSASTIDSPALGAIAPPPFVPEASDSLTLEPATGGPAEVPPETAKFEVVPVKMLAQGNVRARSEQFQGETNQLEIWFDRRDTPPAIQETAPPADRGATPFTNTDRTRDAEKPPAEVKRLELSGTQIRLRLWMVKPHPTVREATVMGQVRLAQLATVPTDPIPLLVTGDMLQLRVDHLERAEIDVQGEAERPARVHAQGMLLEGTNLHLSQRENLMWSNGPGRTRLPVRANRDRSLRQNGPILASNAPIWISWQGGMDFDGQLVRFMKHVEVSGIYTSKTQEQLYLRSIGDQLHATLNRYVEFAKSKKTNDLDVIELRFLGDVFTDNQTFRPDSTLTSHDRMRARDLTLDRRTGHFAAVGPGWITTTRVDKGMLDNRVNATPLPSPPGQTPYESQDELIYLRVDFQNAIEGNLDLRKGKFVHYVRAVYGPVLTWNQVLDPDRHGGLGSQGIVLTCNQLDMAETGEGTQRGVEMSALGNTVAEGDQFVARADRMTYVQAKDQLILESTERNFASLQRQSRVGEQPAEFQAKKIIYGVKSGQYQVFGARKLDFNQLGAPDMPRARIR